MTDLLPARASASSDPGETRASRRLLVTAALAGVAAPLLVVFVLWAVGLVAWFAADGGSHGSTLSVLRIAGDGWILAHGGTLTLPGRDAVTITASPLGLTVVCALVTVRLARWAASLSSGGTLGDATRAAGALAGAYAATGLVVALVCRGGPAAPGLVSTVVGAGLLGGAAGWLGLVLGTQNVAAARALVPFRLRSVIVGAVATGGLVLAAGAALTAFSLAWHGPAAARIAERLDLDLAGGAFSLLLAAAVAPNAALLATAYLAGPGFAVGTGTVVSTAQVSVGPLPSVPLLAAVPGDGVPPAWLGALLAVPPLLALVGAVWAARVVPTRSWREGALRGTGGGLLAAVLLTVATAWAGGSIGPGRMSDLGAPLLDLLTWNALGLGLGGLLGGIAGTWWGRRSDWPEAVQPERVPRGPRPITLYPQRLAPLLEQDPTVDADEETSGLSPAVRRRLAQHRLRHHPASEDASGPAGGPASEDTQVVDRPEDPAPS